MRPFTDTLRGIRSGRVIDEATAKLSLVLQHVVETRKPGAVSITLTITPDKTDRNAVKIGAKVSHKVPNAELPDATFFVNFEEEGLDLSRHDPTQREMFTDASDRERAASAV